MLSTFILSFKLKNTYRVNSIIYSIKQLPIIRKILKANFYKSKALKIIGNIISIIIELCNIFLGKLIYIFLCIFSIYPTYKTNNPNLFIHIFLFLTLIGAIMNTYMFNPTKDKYYAMIIMNMDAKKYTLSNYIYAMIKTFIGFMPFTIIFGLLLKVPLYICILMPLFVVFCKTTYSAYILRNFNKTKIALNENNLDKKTWIIIGILLLIAYLLPYINIVINEYIFIIFFIISLILFIIGFKTINSFNKYKQIYKQILTNENVYAVENAKSTKQIKERSSKQIELDKNFTSTKHGFAYFHELFVKRHSKILTKAIKKQSIVVIFIFVILTIVVLTNKDIAKKVNAILLVSLPYFVFVMYMLNRGTSLTEAMFMNCDHSMLTYRIYRTPKVILGVFKERLKTLMIINLIPALLIGSGLSFLLYISGGTNETLNYIILFVSIIAMSIFFSVHYLVMYYLLQPYNVNTEIKSSTYSLIQGLTYFVCYFFIGEQLPTFYFGLATIIFSITYSLISLYLVYKFAPKTFKLRI